MSALARSLAKIVKADDGVVDEATGLTKAQAIMMLTKADKDGLTPKPEHLAQVYGPTMAAELADLSSRKQEAEARAFAHRIARQKGETMNRNPSGASVADVENAIRIALENGEASAQPKTEEKPSSETPAAEPEANDPAKLAADIAKRVRF